MKKNLIFFISISLTQLVYSQQSKDTLKVSVPETNPTNTPASAPSVTVPVKPTKTGRNSEYQKDTITDLGVAVAPSSIRYRTKPGTTETKYITVTNDTYKPQKLKVSFADYTMDNNGGTKQLPIGQNYEYGISKWMSVSPGYFELGPGEKKKVAVTLTIPEEPSAYRAGWGIIMIDQTKEKDFIAPPKDKDGKVVMGVIPVFGFGVYIFQNPPNVQVNKVEITKFLLNYDKSNRYISISAKNTGTGLGFCKAYVDVQNINSGFKEKIPIRQFTIFPGMERSFDYTVPGNLPKGSYIATAVLDFGSDTEAIAVDLEFKVE